LDVFEIIFAMRPRQPVRHFSVGWGKDVRHAKAVTSYSDVGRVYLSEGNSAKKQERKYKEIFHF
jgi:hypothetical protein